MLKASLALLSLIVALPAFAQEQLTVAAAADSQPALTRIARQFEQQSGSKVKLSFGSSGNLFAQVQNGAPYDVFLSADISYPNRLEAAGLAEPESLFHYGTGRLVLWIPNGSSIAIDRGLQPLVDQTRLKKLAIANPAHAPYGRAAEAALKSAGVWNQLSSKLVLGENISQAAQFVQSGNADAGILALSLALTPKMRAMGRYYEIPTNLYPPLDQAGIILRTSTQKQLARQFVNYLKTPAASSILNEYGFSKESKIP